jgi:hypothetical protein
LPVGVAGRSGGADERISDTVARDCERFLRRALERHDRQMPALAEIADVEVEPDTWLTADERSG